LCEQLTSIPNKRAYVSGFHFDAWMISGSHHNEFIYRFSNAVTSLMRIFGRATERH